MYVPTHQNSFRQFIFCVINDIMKYKPMKIWAELGENRDFGLRVFKGVGIWGEGFRYSFLEFNFITAGNISQKK